MYNKLVTHAKFSRSPKANLKSIHKYIVLQRKGVFRLVGVERRGPWLARCGLIKSKSLETVDFQKMFQHYTNPNRSNNNNSNINSGLSVCLYCRVHSMCGSM